MYSKKYRRLLGIFCMLLGIVSLHAQYKIEGGSGTPLLVNDDTQNRIQVYMLNGLSNARITYTSSSTSHQWYRYNTKALEAERVTHTQEGTTSYIQDITDGYGYFVEENGSLAASRYVWIIDYNQHAFNINNLYVNENLTNCSALYLQGDANPDRLSYWTPGGSEVRINRDYEISYQNLEWKKESLSFLSRTVTETVPQYETATLSGFNIRITDDIPLMDTEFKLSGDLFARHFGIEKTVYTNFYEAIALSVDTTMVITSVEGDNVLSGEDGASLSAPIEVHLKAYANEPVASIYVWRIINSENPDNPIVRNGDELYHTFVTAGTYTIQLEVGNRHNGSCVVELETDPIKVRESMLEIPNVFTPGTSPGVNDEFKVAYKSLVSFKGWIFNRWGNQLFHWTDPSQGWDGKKGGKYVAPGVYYYVIEATGADGEKYLKKGDINIIRPKNSKDEIIQ